MDVIYSKKGGIVLDVAFISDLHLGHNAIAKLRGFDNIDEYNEEVIKRWNSVCGKKTMVIMPGDVAMENAKYYQLLDRMLGRKICIGGNHDLKGHSKELLKHVECIIGCMKYKDFIVTHIPIHTQEVERFSGNIHGHTHMESVKKKIYSPGTITVRETRDKRYINVSWDALEGVPIGMEKIIQLRSE